MKEALSRKQVARRGGAVFPARRRLVSGRVSVSVSGPESSARWLRSRMGVVVIQDESSSEVVTSNKAQGARAPRKLLVALGGR